MEGACVGFSQHKKLNFSLPKGFLRLLGLEGPNLPLGKLKFNCVRDGAGTVTKGDFLSAQGPYVWPLVGPVLEPLESNRLWN